MAKEQDLETSVADELVKHFNDPIDKECPYCEATKAVILIIRKAVAEEIERELEGLLISTSSMEAVTLPMPNFYIRETALKAFWEKYLGKGVGG